MVMRIIINIIAIMCAAFLVSGVHVSNPLSLIMFAAVLGLFNVLVKPLLLIITAPISILTLGLFILVINGFTTLIASEVVPGFNIDSLWTGIVFSIVNSIISFFLSPLKEDDDDDSSVKIDEKGGKNLEQSKKST